jgi:hypothetical protein
MGVGQRRSNMLENKEVRNLAFIGIAIVMAILICVASIGSGAMLAIVVSIVLLALLCCGLGYLYCKYEDDMAAARRAKVAAEEERKKAEASRKKAEDIANAIKQVANAKAAEAEAAKAKPEEVKAVENRG